MIKTQVKEKSKIVQKKAVDCSSFNGEYFISVCPEKNKAFEETLADIKKTYFSELKKLGLSEKTQVFCRFYLSDIASQKESFLNSEIFKFCQNGSYSVIEQCPLHGGKAALFAYHVKDSFLKKETFSLDDKNWKNAAKISGKNYTMLFASNLLSDSPSDSEKQTASIFSEYKSLLEKNNQTLLGNSVRTWIYVRDIDNNYQGMVKARREFFEKEGLNKDTRFIASTGIEGKPKEISSTVSMDAVSVSNLNPRQIVRMEARENLNPTHEYGVTFERGSRIDFGDRSHLYISGTASIDKEGKVLHVGNVQKQTERVLQNIEALLKPHRSNLRDMMYFIVYVRNITDSEAVKKILHSKDVDKKPLIFVEGAVCRPTWLVEIEGMAIIPNKSNWPEFL